MKVKEIIEITKRVDNSSLPAYSEILSNSIVDVVVGDDGEICFEWDWWDIVNLPDNEDLQITVKYYHPDYDPMFDDDAPIAQFTTMQRDIMQR
uniref:Phage protein n=1 Tax=Dulem virus 39 TaxID=3145757 RepID=A0AAU8B8D5_9CAUD